MIFRNKVKIEKKNIAKFFDGRVLNYLKNKKPKSESYPFIQHDPLDIYGDESNLESFYLIGDNWANGQNKPIAVMWGFNDWKLGFTSDYLPEYRTLFVPLRMSGFRAIRKLKKHLDASSVFIAWGFNERRSAKRYAKYNNIPLWRMEDAFIRSSALGASHATPYSLILDKTGFYYDCSQPSDIENILNTTDFKAKPELLDNAQKALNTLIELKLSKYNPPSNNCSRITDKIKTRKRIVVLGQVDADASIRLGNPDNWNAEELVKLAKFENPEAEILYRPHPEIFKGYQKSRFKKKRIERIASVVSPDEPFIKSLDSIDHVYTITSLSGLEALLRGKKVTVVGVPFYSGWGLTDDRVKIERRTSKLELLELFAGTYLLYPIYLANLSDSYLGLKAAAYRINAEKLTLGFDQAINNEGNSVEFFPAMLLREGGTLNEKIKGVDFSTLFFKSDQDSSYQVYIMLFILGFAMSDNERNQVLLRARTYLSLDIFNEILSLLDLYYPGDYVQENLSWLLGENGEFEKSTDILIKVNEERLRYDELAENHIGEREPKVNERIDSGQMLFNILENSYSQRDMEASQLAAKKLLLLSFDVAKVFNYAALICELKFQYCSFSKMSIFYQKVDLYASNRRAIKNELRASKFSDIREPSYYFQLYSKSMILKPDAINDVIFLSELLDIEAKEEISTLVSSMLFLDNELSQRKILAYLAIEDFNKAHSTVKSMFNSREHHSSSDYVLYSQVLSYLGRAQDAYDLICLDRKRKVTSVNLRESLRLCVLLSDYKESLNLLELARQHQIEIGDMHKRKAYFGNSLIQEAFHTFTELSLVNTVKKYFPKQALELNQLSNKENLEGNLLLLAIFGPGDEIRFSSIYNTLIEEFNLTSFTISCTPRLYPLLTRSFPAVNFIAVPRPRTNDVINLEEYNEVPGSDISSVVNDIAVAEINRCGKYYFVTDLLHHCLTSYESFKGTSYLQADQEKIKVYRQRLEFTSNKIVGLTWRSSLNTHSRNEHYLTIEELEPLFSIPGITFVNFQYDECDEELVWVEDRYPGKLIDFKDVDHFNDFDSVAALINCVDLMIAPCTTVVELAGALGCPTWLFSNSSEIDWRKIDAAGTDVWHNSISIVEGKTMGDKLSLVEELSERLSSFSQCKVKKIKAII
jgi:capsular polysaccharide export protein